MPCYHPISAYQSPGSPVVFQETSNSQPLEIPCGRCIGCRLERSRQWAVRCIHEASLYEDNSFITLTYDDRHLPHDGSLQLRHLQLFFKDFRRLVSPKRVRYFACGEYGDQLGRPHYHAIIFNHRFPNRELVSQSNGLLLWSSPQLSKLWYHGLHSIGDVTFESAAYTARYCTKKVFGDGSTEHYARMDEHGSVTFVVPEFAVMSRNPGIGHDWFINYFNSDLRKGFFSFNGVRQSLPRSYQKLIYQYFREVFDEHKLTGYQSSLHHAHDNTTERLLVKESIKLRKFEKLIRGFENDTQCL